MVDRISALAGHYGLGHHGDPERSGVILQDVADLKLHQVAVWPESIDKVGKILAKQIGATKAASPCSATGGKNGTMLRIEPMKWWLFGAEAPELDAKQGMTLDISHSRTHLRVSGDDATEFLNRHFPIDFRATSFAEGSVASSVTHHVGVTIWHSANGFELFMPRGFALALWEGLVESAEQFGVEVR